MVVKGWKGKGEKGSGNQSFTDAYLAQIIRPGNAKPLPGEHAGQSEIQKWIL
jgi:hypothetical protein